MAHKITGRTAADIARSIEGGVFAGRFALDVVLPPVRDLAATLHVSPATAAAAYRLLRLRGVIVSDGRRGTRVRSPMPQSSEASSPAVALPRGRRSTSFDAVRSHVVDLSSGNPDPDLLPPMDLALEGLPAAPRLYGHSLQLPALGAFVSAEFAADGIPSSFMAVTSGTLDAIDRVLRERLRPGDRVAVEDPCFPPMLDLLAVSGFTAEPVAVDDEGPMVEAFERALRRRVRAAIVTARGQNPFGCALSSDRARDLTRVLRLHRDVLLVENDPMAPIAGVPLHTLCDGSQPAWVAVRSTAKFLGPDIRVAMITGDAVTIGRVQRRQMIGPGWVSHLLQSLAVTLWSDPSAARRLARASDIYAARRRALVNELSGRGIGTRGRSGFNLWVPVREEAAVVRALANDGWAVAAGERFRLRSGPAIRITTSALPPDAAARLASDLARSLRPVDAVRA